LPYIVEADGKMKTKNTDNYLAKVAIWISEPKVYPLPEFSGLPRFGSRKFDSYEEFNSWKKEFLGAIASRGGVKWKK